MVLNGGPAGIGEGNLATSGPLAGTGQSVAPCHPGGTTKQMIKISGCRFCQRLE